MLREEYNDCVRTEQQISTNITAKENAIDLLANEKADCLKRLRKV